MKDHYEIAIVREDCPETEKDVRALAELLNKGYEIVTHFSSGDVLYHLLHCPHVEEKNVN